MDGDAFDRLARTLGIIGSRRAALGALIAAGIASAGGSASAKRRHRGKRKAGRRVTAQAACANPGPGTNLDGCDFSGQELSGVDLSRASLRGANFSGANLTDANLSSSNARRARFSQARLCGAKVRSANLLGATFAAADLTGADFALSNCTATDFANAVFCRTKLCNGSVREPDCTRCCLACGPCQVCESGRCVAVPNRTVACDGTPLVNRGASDCAEPGTKGVCVDGQCSCGPQIYDPGTNTCSCAPGECSPGTCCAVTQLCASDFGIGSSTFCTDCV